MAKSESRHREKDSDGNSEESLIRLIRSVLIEEFKEILVALHKNNQNQIKIMTALETLTEAVNAAAVAQTDLTTAVNAAIVQIGTPSATDTQILTAATAVTANTASDVSLTKALNDALTPAEPPVV